MAEWDQNGNEAAAPEKGGGSRVPQRRQADAAERAREDLRRRVPPHSEEAEQAVLSGVFLRPDLLHEILDEISETDFYLPAHRVIFGAFSALYAQNMPVDEVTVFDWLSSHKQLEAAGGSSYLADLSGAVVSGANAAHWAKIVRDKSMQRALIDTSAQIISNCYDSAKDIPLLVDESEKAIFSISERANSRTFVSSADLVHSVFDQLLARYNNKNPTTGIPTGYHGLDRMTGGLQPTDLIIIAARPSMGKTAFALNVAMRAALSGGATVAVFSLEMSKESLMDRMLCVWGKVELSRVRRGYLEDADWQKLSNAADALSRARIFIDDTAGLSPLTLRARCRRLKADQGLDMIIVDYLQLMHSSRNDSRELEISDISRNLKALAKELNVPVIALSQLNRKVEERTDKRPVLSDLRESGAIEQDADVIMFIHREDAYNKKNDRPKTGIAEIIIGKHRNGPTGTVELLYRPEYTAFEELDASQYAASQEAAGQG